MIEICGVLKGQKFSKAIYGFLNSPKKMNEKNEKN